MKLTFHATTDIGRKAQNEDAFLCHERLGLFAVADGISSHGAGDIASREACEALREFIESHWNPDDSTTCIDVTLRDALQSSNSRLRAVGRALKASRNGDEHQRTAASTIVVTWFFDDCVLIGHVGDSRVYRCRNGLVEKLTSDHTLGEMIKRHLAPQCETDQVVVGKHVVMQALGLKDSIEPDLRIEALQENDIFLLCSDGLTSSVPESTISTLLKDPSGGPEKIASALAQAAKTAGAKDNVTSIVVAVSGVVPWRGRRLAIVSKADTTRIVLKKQSLFSFRRILFIGTVTLLVIAALVVSNIAFRRLVSVPPYEQALLERKKNPGRAAVLFHEALESGKLSERNTALAYLYRGDALFFLHQTKAAEDAVRQALKLAIAHGVSLAALEPDLQPETRDVYSRLLQEEWLVAKSPREHRVLALELPIQEGLVSVDIDPLTNSLKRAGEFFLRSEFGWAQKELQKVDELLDRTELLLAKALASKKEEILKSIGRIETRLETLDQECVERVSGYLEYARILLNDSQLKRAEQYVHLAEAAMSEKQQSVPNSPE